MLAIDNLMCPNVSYMPYKETIAKHGEDYAFKAWVLSGYKGFDSVAEAENIIASKDAANKEISKNVKKELLDVLKIQKAAYSKRPSGKKYVEQITDVIEELQGDNSLVGLIKMLNIAALNSKEILARLSTLKAQAKNVDKLSPDELTKLAELLQEMKRYISTYNILQDLEDVFPADHPDMKLLEATMKNNRAIARQYKELHEEVISSWLASQAERVNANLKAQGKTEYILTKARIKDLLNTATSDISTWEKLFGSQANSKDPLTGLVAARIKEEAYKVHLDNAEIQENLVRKYRLSGGSNNPAEFNARYLKDVYNWEFIPTKDAEGKLVYDDKGVIQGERKYVKRKAFVTEFKEDTFWRDYKAYISTLPEVRDEASLIARLQAKEAWMLRNTVLKEDPQDIIDRKKRTLTPLEFDRWMSENTERISIKYYSNGATNMNYWDSSRIHKAALDGKSFTVYKPVSDFYRPADNYKDAKFEELKSDSYYQALYKAYSDANERVHPSKRLKYGIIPQKRKTGYDRYINGNGQSLNQNLKEDFNHAVNIESYDTSYGIQTPDKKDLKQIPIYYTELLNEGELSLDLLESTLAYYQMANNYNSMSKVEPFIEMLTDAIEGNAVVDIEPRDVQILNARGEVKVNPITGKPLSDKSNKVNEALIEFLDKVVYGEYEIPSLFKVGDKEYSKNKLASMALKAASINGLAFNINSFFNNTLLGNFTMAIESLTGQYMTKGDLLSAEGIYFANFAAFMGDIANGYPRSKYGKLMIKYDVMQGNFADSYGENLSGTAAKRAMTSDSLFFLTHGAEHQIQTTGFIAMMRRQEVKYTDGTTSSLDAAYDDKGNLKPGAIWSKEDQFNFMQKVHALNKGMHGIYNKFDSPTLKRRWYGKLALLFRNWIYSGVQRRWSGEFLNIENGVVEHGYYNKFFSELYKELKQGKADILFGRNLTDDQKAARIKALAEITTALAIFIMIAALAGGDDDEDDNSWVTNQVILQGRRLAGDIMFFLPIDPFAPMRVLKNPSAAITLWEKSAKLIYQFTDPFEQYDRKTGDNIMKDMQGRSFFDDILPIYNQLQRALNPEQAIKEYRLF